MEGKALNTRALVLFAHGARDARWAEPFQRLQQIVSAQQPDVTVALAFLELMAPQLPELVQQLEDSGHTEVTVVPVFFGQGGHVLRDLPRMVDQLRQDHPELTLKVAQAVGEDADVLNAVAQYCVDSLARQ
jgi:sirohydrochlorin cobaltochelatase